MAVQIPDPGTGNGQTGDNEYVFRKKVKDNFSDQNNAASKIIGTGANQVPLAPDVFEAYAKKSVLQITNTDTYTSANQFPLGSKIYINSSNTAIADMPLGFISGDYTVVETLQSLNSRRQVAYGHYDDYLATRTQINGGSTWTEWKAAGQTVKTYRTTTAAGANVVVDTSGKLMRSTSSERYKDILAPLELDDARYADAMALKPIVYRSTADADNPAYHFYSFSAEELGAYDPAFTLWRETETVADADGNVTEQPLAERQAEGININALLAMSHAIAIKQDKLIKALEARIEILEAK